MPRDWPRRKAASHADDGDGFALGPLQTFQLGAQFPDLDEGLLHQGLFVDGLGGVHKVLTIL